MKNSGVEFNARIWRGYLGLNASVFYKDHIFKWKIKGCNRGPKIGSVKKIGYKWEINKIFLLNKHTNLGMNALCNVHRLSNL